MPQVTDPQPATQTTGKTVLCIEDEPELIALISLMLKRNGYNVVSSASLKAAKQALAQSVPDVVLLDMHLPDGSGWDVLAWMKQQPELADVPIILVTGDADVEYHHRNKGQDKNGVAGVLMKPFTLQTLRNAVQFALFGRPTPNAAAG